jgi:hypothetical protein
MKCNDVMMLCPHALSLTPDPMLCPLFKKNLKKSKKKY